MKTLIAAILMIAFSIPAFAAGNGGAAFALFSTASAGVKTTAVYDIRAYRSKTMSVSGVTLASNATSITYKNMSGTLITQCAPTSSGPWATCTQSQVASAPAVSLTANNQLTWADSVPYIRLKWTGSTTGQKIKAWLNWMEN